MSLICFDIDGTLANIDHRLGYVRSKPKNWAAFDAGIPNDAVNQPVAAVFHDMAKSGNTIILASGRNERSRHDTVAWLRKNNLNFYQKLYMRKADDYRADDIIKREILAEIVTDFGRKPDMWFDDRPRVVKAIRSQGVFVFDVYQGTEDF
jgi:hydroxymethylpyrimidine pyrophosphatase-like HAD family hydrolase